MHTWNLGLTILVDGGSASLDKSSHLYTTSRPHPQSAKHASLPSLVSSSPLAKTATTPSASVPISSYPVTWTSPSPSALCPLASLHRSHPPSLSGRATLSIGKERRGQRKLYHHLLSSSTSALLRNEELETWNDVCRRGTQGARREETLIFLPLQTRQGLFLTAGLDFSTFDRTEQGAKRLVAVHSASAPTLSTFGCTVCSTTIGQLHLSPRSHSHTQTRQTKSKREPRIIT
ncbi:hypothetical protein BCV69DRAFT_4042 [Microstroma glucosiphilum]|uniref:Uncharacterized protein n=1 Tax=Pseudomicrostroma glucosiphilum TaxID=1684307 RepID=A0A316UF78_9BASI|nr:hypothetical protein BCV69DRAFT_4042 [Pseudomicrostroma glucosiphilum]PWN23588.1 hypothetical protein BCV69DRAFT_4042 [Pseudomicrostroma glucosiphilum]